MKRRDLLTGTAAAGIVGLSGCLSGILGTVTSLESTPAGVSQSALDATGYEAVGIEELGSEEEVEAGGQSEVIEVTSYLTEYEKQVGVDGIAETATATFAVLSTPQLDIAGQTLNPVADMSGRELAELIGDNYDSIDGIEHDGDQMVTILEQSVTKSRFVADASVAGLPLDLDMHVTEAAERGDDLLVAVGVYPRQFRMIEAANARELTESITADVDTGSESDEPNESTDNGSTDNESTDNGSTDNGSTDNGSTDNESTDNGSDDGLGGIAELQ